ncbi:MAG: amidohydrolase [Dehalococcoidia bacterium]|nr:amidohydrolase [Dehalococcoidia bacterium]
MAALLLSTDSHVVEPPDLWKGRVPAQYRDRAPKLVADPTADYWYVDGIRATTVASGIQPGLRYEGIDKLRLEGRFSEVKPGAYNPDAKIKAMDLDGVDGEVVYTTICMRMWRIPDAGLLMAIQAGYNDWIAEFCRAHPKRLKGIGLVLLDDVQTGVRELERCAKMGLAGAMISVYPHEDFSYDRPMYDPFWAAASSLDMPLSLHIGTNRTLPPTSSSNRDMSNSDIKLLSTPALYSTFPYWVQMSLANMIFGGVFERFPKLQVLSVEHEASWAAFFLNAMDYTYTQRALRANWPRFTSSSAIPSDFFHRNVSLSFQEDPLVMRLRDVIGVRNLVWGSDYPHPETTFPKSRETLARILHGMPEAEQRRVQWENAQALYRFN